jgi:two-component system, cell cycle response regulator DivK
MKPTILLIEDNEQNLYLATFLLSQSGYNVLQARRPSEAVALIKKTCPDLILMDIQLPEMDGHTFARELRRLPALADVAIIAVTSYAMSGDREKALEAGCADYIEKPINPDTFVAQVARHLPAKKEGGSCPGS